MKLYELTQTFNQLLELDIEESDLTTALDSLEGTVKEKAEGILMVMKTLEAEQNGYKAEIDRLNTLKKQSENKSNGMKKYLSDNLQQMNIDKLETPLFKLSFRKSTAVIIDDQEKLPEIYLKEKTTITPDKTALKKALKDGVIEGCHIQTNQSLQIK